jgi:hypothetical protein
MPFTVVLSFLRYSGHVLHRSFICLVPHSCCPLCHCCILGSSKISSLTSILSGFLMRPHLWVVTCGCVPLTVPLLHGWSCSCRQQPFPSVVHNFPGSEFS